MLKVGVTDLVSAPGSSSVSYILSPVYNSPPNTGVAAPRFFLDF